MTRGGLYLLLHVCKFCCQFPPSIKVVKTNTAYLYKYCNKNANEPKLQQRACRRAQHSQTIGFWKFRCKSIKTPLFSDDVIMPDNINIKAFWDVQSCSLVHGSNVSNGRAASFLGPAAGSSETFVPTYQATECHIPKDCNRIRPRASQFTITNLILISIYLSIAIGLTPGGSTHLHINNT
jgi:hypothetical protein